MVGSLSMDVTVEVNNQLPIGGDTGETVTVTLTLQVFQPGTLTPVTA